MEERAVSFGGRWFTSQQTVAAWIINEMGSNDTAVGLLSVDVVSLLQLMRMDFGSLAERLDQEYKGSRVEMNDPVFQVF
jgi:hypothetical protein